MRSALGVLAVCLTLPQPALAEVPKLAPPGREVKRRTVTLSGQLGGDAAELHVAAGTATIVSFSAPLVKTALPPANPEDGLSVFPLGESKLIVAPQSDLAEHDRRALVIPTVDGLFTLALSTVSDQVDLEVQVLRSPAPALGAGDWTSSELAGRFLDAIGEDHGLKVRSGSPDDWNKPTASGFTPELRSLVRVDPFLVIVVRVRVERPAATWHFQRARLTVPQVADPKLLSASARVNPASGATTLVLVFQAPPEAKDGVSPNVQLWLAEEHGARYIALEGSLP